MTIRILAGLVLGTFLMFPVLFAQGPDPIDFAGNWTGRWENLTFGSKDSASLTVTIDTTLRTLSAVLDLDGNVFGGSDPPPITLNGVYDDEGFSASGSQAPYGDMTLSGDTAGNLAGSAVNVPNAGIDSVSMSGTYDAAVLALNYVVHFAFGGGTANGIITMEKQTATGVGDGSGLLPARVLLHQNYPNPFNPSTVIAYELPRPAAVRLTVSDLLGRVVAVVVDEVRQPGSHVARWDAGDAPAGVYYYVLETNGFRETGRMILIR